MTMPSRSNRWPRTRHILSFLMVILATGSTALAGWSPPGGFIEKATDTNVRPPLTPQQIQALLPLRGPFVFSAPYLTQGVRITNATDCTGAGDCVIPVGYSYWRNINNHTASNTMLIFLGLDRTRGGTGPTLFAYDKTTELVTNRGALFDAGSRFADATAEGWYFSATMPTTIYLNDGSKMLRYDVNTRQFQTVYDAASQFGADKYIWQMHSSNDDRIHSATLRQSSTDEMLGCLLYNENTAQFSYFPKKGDFDECAVDKSGQWLVILDNVDLKYGEDNRIINLQTGEETLLMDQNGAAGHCDLGYGYMVNEDDWASVPGAERVWKFGQPLVPGPGQGVIAYQFTDWSVGAGHISHENAQAGVAPEQQYACYSDATRSNTPRSNEIACYRLDSSLDVLVVAPVMTDLDAAGGGSDDYSKRPKGNLDVTGDYFIWTSNMSADRLDAFLVKVPSQLLLNPTSDSTPPSVSITSPHTGDTVSGTIPVTATATDNVGVVGVQFKLDGNNLGAEDMTAPYEISWDTTAAADGSHTLTGVARDAAGNTSVSTAVTVTVRNNDTTPPVISAVASSNVTSTTARITWTTNEGSDSQVDYGTTSAYGSSSALDPTLVTSHSEGLSGLQPGTLYHYRVKSRDAAGNLAVSDDHTFMTSSSLDSGRAGHWRLDETSGSSASDSSGNGNAGTLLNGPVWTAGKVGGALSFDGVNDYLSVPHQSSLNAYPLSVALWVKTSSSGATKGILNKYLNGSKNGYMLSIKSGRLNASYFRSASSYVGDSSGAGLSAGAINDGQWHQVVLVVDASGGRLYVDDVLQASKGWVGAAGPPTSTQDVRFARHVNGSQPYMQGLLDDVRIYSRALSTAEIDELYRGSP